MSKTTPQTILNFLAAQLVPLYDSSEAHVIIELLLEHLHIDKVLPADMVDATIYAQPLQALQSGQPIQQIIGYAYFWDRYYKVTADTLIPRPETEELMYWIKNSNFQNINNIIDIGTGSGCIACTLKVLFPHAQVYALDIIESAIDVARENAKQHQLNINFIKADILSNVNLALPKFDLIVSNPPYITVEEKRDMHQNVLAFEPHSALFVTDNDPQQFYKAIENFSKAHLAAHGNIFLELNKAYGAQTEKLFKNWGYETVLKQDMQGADRMLRAWN